MKNGICPKCNSHEIVENLPMIEHGHLNYRMDFSLIVDTKPEALVFSGAVKSQLYAWVCAQCGYVELYTTHPEALLEAQRQARASTPTQE